MLAQARLDNQHIRWKHFCGIFTNRYDSVTKQNGISNRLVILKMEDVKDEDDDDYAALDKHIARIDQLTPMARPKDRADKAKVRFLSSAINGTTCGLAALQRLPAEPSYQ